MTDKEVYIRFMKMAGFKQEYVIPRGDNEVVLTFYSDEDDDLKSFTKVGYQDFRSGAKFDKDGNLIIGYLDSHVAYDSENSKEINKLLPQDNY